MDLEQHSSVEGQTHLPSAREDEMLEWCSLCKYPTISLLDCFKSSGSFEGGKPKVGETDSQWILLSAHPDGFGKDSEKERLFQLPI